MTWRRNASDKRTKRCRTEAEIRLKKPNSNRCSVPTKQPGTEKGKGRPLPAQGTRYEMHPTKRRIDAELKPKFVWKSRTPIVVENLQSNPELKKGRGGPYHPKEPLTNLTTIKLSRKRSPGTSSRTCVDSMRCKVHPELFLLTPLTQPIRKRSDLDCLEVGRCVQICSWLISWEVGGLVCGLLRGKWSGLVVCCVENGLDWKSAARKMVCSIGLKVVRKGDKI